MPTLYEAGWRRGSVLSAALTTSCAVVEDGHVVERRVQHDLWLVVTQDCNLATLDVNASDPVVELRPVRTSEHPVQLGVRSKYLRLRRDPPAHLFDVDLRLMVSPQAIATIQAHDLASREDWLNDDGDLAALTLWLGRRYDRPAVPDEYVALVRRLATVLKARAAQPRGERIRDVFVEVEAADPPTYHLLALVEEERDVSDAEALLAECVLDVSTDLGNVGTLVAAPSARFPLAAVEKGFLLDVSQLTWGAAP